MSRRQLPYETVTVAVADGVRLALDVFQGPVDQLLPGFLLVHGLASNARLYDGLAFFLQSAGATVAAVDLRGHGRSDKPDSGYDYETLCQDLMSVISELARRDGFSEALVVVGQSFGGNLVLELAYRHPEAMVGVACIDGGTIDLQAGFSSYEEAEAALRPPQVLGTAYETMAERFSAMHPDWPEEAIAGALANFELRPDDTVAPRLTLQRHLAILQTMWQHPPSELYASLQVPVLFIPVRSPGAPGWAAAKEAATDAALQRIPAAEVHWFEGDHDIHAQHPGEVATVLVAACASFFSP
jgi:pimeloyl-ACP methyl ester carboxylesterase